MGHKANLCKIGAVASMVLQIKWVMKTSEYIYISIFIFMTDNMNMTAHSFYLHSSGAYSVELVWHFSGISENL